LTQEAFEGVKNFDRQALHAAVLGFEHPISGEKLRFEARLPDDMANLINTLRHGVS
jgi:23S rRNA pseudouridine1911/1915/1917 synthase